MLKTQFIQVCISVKLYKLSNLEEIQYACVKWDLFKKVRKPDILVSSKE
jgi:hypothetical protein